MNKYIIYQGSGGLVQLLGGLVYCIDYINYTREHFTLIIDIKNHQAFGNYFSKYFKLINFNKKYSEDYEDIKNVKDYFRIPLSEFNKKNVDYINGSGYLFSYNNKFINIGQDLRKINFYNNLKIYAGHGGHSKYNTIKYIRCNDNIIKMLNEKYKIDEKYIAVHFRNTDRFNNINDFINKIKKYKQKKVYIATDDTKAINIFKEKLVNYDLIYYYEPPDFNGENIHFNNPDKDQVVMSIIIDMFMMYNSEIFIDSPNSCISLLVNYMRSNKKSIFDSI